MKTKTKKLKSLKGLKLSELLAMAIREVKKCEKLKTVRVDMGTWYRSNGECVVCAAGAVMRGCLVLPEVEKVNGQIELEPSRFDEQTSNALHAIDSLRQGYVSEAANYAGQYRAYRGSSVRYRDVANYRDNRKQWHADMKVLLADLREAGL